MLTLSDTESNLHFILILQGLIRHKQKGERGEGRQRRTLGGDDCRSKNVSEKEKKRSFLLQNRSVSINCTFSTQTFLNLEFGRGNAALVTDINGKLSLSLSSEPFVVPIRVELVYRQHILREILANITSHVSNTHINQHRRVSSAWSFPDRYRQ